MAREGDGKQLYTHRQNVKEGMSKLEEINSLGHIMH